MSLQSIFKYQEAIDWNREMDTLNKETDDLLAKVATSIKSVKDGCEGEVVDTVVNSGEQMGEKFRDLIRAAGKLVSALAEVIRRFEDFEDTTLNAIKKGIGDHLGGITL